MGILRIPERKDRWSQNDGIYQYRKGYYGCQDTVEGLVRYITRTRKGECREDDVLITGCCGTCGGNIEDIIYWLVGYQHASGIDTGSKGEMYHEVLYLEDGEIAVFGGDRDIIVRMMMSCACIYRLAIGFPVVFALHWEAEKGFHVHFAVSGISKAYEPGRWHTSLKSVQERNIIFNNIILQEHRLMAKGTEPASGYLY